MHYPSMAKKNEPNVPSRRRERGNKLTKALWAYVSPEEYELVQWAANLERRAMSSWIADIVLERCHELARLYSVASSNEQRPSARDSLELVKKPRKPK